MKVPSRKANFHETWTPTQDICIVMDDKTGEQRSPDKLDELFEKLRAVANEHGFDLSHWGTSDSIITYQQGMMATLAAMNEDHE